MLSVSASSSGDCTRFILHRWCHLSPGHPIAAAGTRDRGCMQVRYRGVLLFCQGLISNNCEDLGPDRASNEISPDIYVNLHYLILLHLLLSELLYFCFITAFFQ